MRVVFDTNCLVIAALTTGSPSALAFDYVQRSERMITSVDLLTELEDLLARPKFDRWASPEARVHFLNRYRQASEQVTSRERLEICRDADDNRVLEVALAAQADFVVTGDQDLLVLDPFRGVRIVTPRRFLEIIAEG